MFQYNLLPLYDLNFKKENISFITSDAFPGAFDHYSCVSKRFKELDGNIMQISSPVILQRSQIRHFNQQRKHLSFSHFLFGKQPTGSVNYCVQQ